MVDFSLKDFRPDQGHEEVGQQQHRHGSDKDVFSHGSKPPAGVAIGHAHGKEAECGNDKHEVLHKMPFNSFSQPFRPRGRRPGWFGQR